MNEQLLRLHQLTAALTADFLNVLLNLESHVAAACRHESSHIEDLVVVTESGCRLLTTIQPVLIQIPA